MFVRPRVLAAALACLPVCLTSSWMPARAGTAHLGIPGRAARVRQLPEDLRALIVAAGPTIYVSTTGNDANSGATPALAKKTIQAGIIATSPTSPTNSGTVLVEPGTYTGAGNFNIDFGALAGGGGMTGGTRNIIVMSDAASGGTPANTIINIAATGASQKRGFTFVRGETAAAQVIGFTIENGNQDSGNGGAIGFGVGTSPTVQNCVFLNNEAALGGAIESAGGSPVIRECTFTGNKAVADGGGFNPGGAIEFFITDNNAYTPVITNCVFSGNSAPTDGAAIDISGDGNGISPKITNCTFTQNTSVSTGPGTGGTIGVFSATPTITNCILYNDTVTGAGEIVLITAAGSPDAVITAKNNDIQGGYPGGNINADPKFASNLDLATSSPAINVGTTSVPPGVDITVDRTLRGRDSQPDLGAYEVLAPTANPQSVAVAFNTAKAVTLSGTDPNLTPRPLTYTVTSGPAHGSLSGTSSNRIYTPDANYSGSDAFTFTVNNGTYISPQVMVTLTVSAGIPTANAQSVTTGQDTAVGITLTGSDPDSPPRSLTYTVTTNPAHGTLMGTAPNLTYTPTAGYNGPDSFQFTVSNGTNTSSAATVSITVTQAVQAPTANSQSVTTNQDTAKAITLTGSDPNSPPHSLTYSVVSNPTHGTLSGTAPNLTYTPAAGYFGADSFTFKVNNGVRDSSIATVSITVVGTPTANSQSVTTGQNTAVGVTLTGSDPNSPPHSLTYSVVSNPAHGTLMGTAPNLTYTPTAGYFGADSFTFKVNNGALDSNTATVSITVTQAVQAPTANSQSVTTGQDTAVGITLTGSDPNSPPRSLTYSVVSNPTHGTLSGTAPNLTYTPTAGYNGPDSFQFMVSNGTNTSSAATVSITVTQAVQAPTANSQNVATNQDTAAGITLTGSDPNSPPLPLTYTVTTNPAHGTLTGTAPNLSYTPTAGYFGADSFTFKVNNGVRDSSTATVSITVTQAVLVAPDVTAQVTVTRGGFRFVRATGHYFQPLTLANTGAALADPLSLVLDNLAGATLVGASGTTAAAQPAGSPYVTLPPGGLGAGASVTVTLEFTARPTGYTARVLAGPGAR